MTTLIKRICNPATLTTAEMSSIDAEVPTANAVRYKVPIFSATSVAQEIMAGRMPQGIIGTWLTAAESADTLTLITSVQNGTWALYDLERIFMLGEREIYTVEQVAGIVGLTNGGQ